jgi:hypothetical protein
VTDLIDQLTDEEVRRLYDKLCGIFPGMDAEVRHCTSSEEDYAREQRSIVEQNLRKGVVRRG